MCLVQYNPLLNEFMQSQSRSESLGCARFPEFVQNFSERQIFYNLCSVAFTLLHCNCLFKLYILSLLNFKFLSVHSKFQQNEHTPGVAFFRNKDVLDGICNTKRLSAIRISLSDLLNLFPLVSFMLSSYSKILICMTLDVHSQFEENLTEMFLSIFSYCS